MIVTIGAGSPSLRRSRLRITRTDDGERVGVGVPHVLEQVLGRQHLAGVVHEVAQQRELAGREAQLAPARHARWAAQVERQVADPQGRAVARRRGGPSARSRASSSAKSNGLTR